MPPLHTLNRSLEVQGLPRHPRPPDELPEAKERGLLPPGLRSLQGPRDPHLHPAHQAAAAQRVLPRRRVSPPLQPQGSRRPCTRRGSSLPPPAGRRGPRAPVGARPGIPASDSDSRVLRLPGSPGAAWFYCGAFQAGVRLPRGGTPESGTVVSVSEDFYHHAFCRIQDTWRAGVWDREPEGPGTSALHTTPRPPARTCPASASCNREPPLPSPHSPIPPPSPHPQPSHMWLIWEGFGGFDQGDIGQ